MALEDPGWDGARNLADLGGLPTSDGLTTAYGRVWRSAAPEWMSAQGWADAARDGLRTVVDLRNEPERRRRPEHPVVPDAARGEIRVVHVPTENPDDDDFLAECGRWLDHPASWTPNLRHFPTLFAAVFTAIADSPGPVLVHCAGGRDRTGLVSSMLLSLARATPGAAETAYATGFRRAADHRGHGLSYDPDAGWQETPDRAWDPEELDHAIADRLPALHEWYDHTDVADYLASAGLDDGRIDRLTRLLR